VLQTKEQFLRNTVEACEHTAVFHRLADATSRAFCRPDRPGLLIEGAWQHALGRFFRLSGTYQELSESDQPRYEDIHQQFHASFTVTKETITYLAPLELVAFDIDVIDLGRFRIQRFTETQLDSLLNHRAKRVFYPWACVATKELVNCWFLLTQDEMERRDPDRFDLKFDPVVRLNYSSLPRQTEWALRCLALYDWGPSAWGGPLTPHLPFVITISDSPIADLVHGPDTKGLTKEWVWNPESGEDYISNQL
jgi:hypothetical protein